MACACGLSLKQAGETNYAFPRPEDLLELAPDTIRELGFSGNTTRAFLELADNIVSGRINFDSLENMDNEAAYRYDISCHCRRDPGRYRTETCRQASSWQQGSCTKQVNSSSCDFRQTAYSEREI